MEKWLDERSKKVYDKKSVTCKVKKEEAFNVRGIEKTGV